MKSTLKAVFPNNIRQEVDDSFEDYKSIFLIVESSSVIEDDTDPNYYWINKPSLRTAIYNYYKNPNLIFDNSCQFLSWNTYGIGTGFLVDSQSIATASHVVEDRNGECYNPNELLCLQGILHLNDNPDQRRRIQYSQIYKIKSIFYTPSFEREDTTLQTYKYGQRTDMAILNLDKEVQDAQPFVFSPLDIQNDGQFLVVTTYGHPRGVPMQFCEGGQILQSYDGSLRHSVNTFPGQSGSPLFIRGTKQVIGMINSVRVPPDVQMSYKGYYVNNNTVFEIQNSPQKNPARAVMGKAIQKLLSRTKIYFQVIAQVGDYENFTPDEFDYLQIRVFLTGYGDELEATNLSNHLERGPERKIKFALDQEIEVNKIQKIEITNPGNQSTLIMTEFLMYITFPSIQTYPYNLIAMIPQALEQKSVPLFPQYTFTCFDADQEDKNIMRLQFASK